MAVAPICRICCSIACCKYAGWLCWGVTQCARTGLALQIYCHKIPKHHTGLMPAMHNNTTHLQALAALVAAHKQVAHTLLHFWSLHYFSWHVCAWDKGPSFKQRRNDAQFLHFEMTLLDELSKDLQLMCSPWVAPRPGQRSLDECLFTWHAQMDACANV